MHGDDPAMDQPTESNPDPRPDSPSSEGESETETPGVPCRHLRNKGAYVYNGIYGVPHDDYDNTIFWCGQTLKGFGPDDEMVGRQDCSCETRSCYQPL